MPNALAADGILKKYTPRRCNTAGVWRTLLCFHVQFWCIYSVATTLHSVQSPIAALLVNSNYRLCVRQQVHDSSPPSFFFFFSHRGIVSIESGGRNRLCGDQLEKVLRWGKAAACAGAHLVVGGRRCHQNSCFSILSAQALPPVRRWMTSTASSSVSTPWMDRGRMCACVRNHVAGSCSEAAPCGKFPQWEIENP